MTAWYQEPDKKEIYIRKDTAMAKNLRLVINYYNDMPTHVNWEIEDVKRDIVTDCGCFRLEHIKEVIEAEGWELVK